MRAWAKLLLLLSPFGVAGTWIEGQLRARGNSYTQKDAQLTAQAGRIRLLALGDSELEQSFDAAAVPGAYNLCHPSQPIYYDSVLLAHYLPRLPRLRTVLVSLGPHRLYETRNAAGSRRHVYDALYLPPSGPVTWLRRELRVLQFSPREGLDFVTHDFAPLPLAACGARFGDACRLPAPGLAEARRNELQTYFDPHERAANLRRLRWMRQACRRRGVTLVLVVPPATARFRRLMAPEHEEATAALRKEGFRLLDASAWVPDSLFQDADHVCRRGAALFTGRLRR